MSTPERAEQSATARLLGVERLIDRAPSLHDLRAHRLHLLAVHIWSKSGRTVPDPLVFDELRAAARTEIAQALMARARGAYSGRLLIFKGPEVASYYPAAHLRPFVDLDFLADNPDAAQAALLRAGFVEAGNDADYYTGLHHKRPLCHPELGGFSIEIHGRPNWPRWSPIPSMDMILKAAVPSRCSADLLAPSPAHHAMLLAAHAWRELPLRRLLDLVDVALVSAETDRSALEEEARVWHISRVWNATTAASDALLGGAPLPLSLRLWARDLPEVRDRTVRETHIRRLAAPFWALPWPQALMETSRAALETLLPAPSDSWSTKIARARKSWKGRKDSSESHTLKLGDDARRDPRFRRLP